MAILKDFREMAGIRGRNTHRGTTPPKYEYHGQGQGGQGLRDGLDAGAFRAHCDGCVHVHLRGVLICVCQQRLREVLTQCVNSV